MYSFILKFSFLHFFFWQKSLKVFCYYYILSWQNSDCFKQVYILLYGTYLFSNPVYFEQIEEFQHTWKYCTRLVIMMLLLKIKAAAVVTAASSLGVVAMTDCLAQTVTLCCAHPAQLSTSLEFREGSYHIIVSFSEAEKPLSSKSIPVLLFCPWSLKKKKKAYKP